MDLLMIRVLIGSCKNTMRIQKPLVWSSISKMLCGQLLKIELFRCHFCAVLDVFSAACHTVRRKETIGPRRSLPPCAAMLTNLAVHTGRAGALTGAEKCASGVNSQAIARVRTDAL